MRVSKITNKLLESNLKPVYVISGVMDGRDPDFLFLDEIFLEVVRGDSYLEQIDEYRREKFKKDIDILRSGNRHISLENREFTKNDLNIIPTQNFVKRDKIRSIASKGEYNAKSFVVVKCLNKYYLIDGHHRFIAWLIYSEPSDSEISISVYDLDSRI